MKLMRQNFGSKPKITCSKITEVVMIIGFLYLIIFSFMVSYFGLLTGRIDSKYSK